MIWRTCGSRQQLVGAQRVLDAGRRVGRPGGHEAQVLRRVGVVAQLAQPAGELGGGPEGRHPVTADQPRDRRVIDAGLLGELALRHLLGLELGSKPFVERSAVLGGHAAWALLGRAACGRTPLVRCLDATMMRTALRRLYHPLVPVGHAARTRPEEEGRVGSPTVGSAVLRTGSPDQDESHGPRAAGADARPRDQRGASRLVRPRPSVAASDAGPGRGAWTRARRRSSRTR